MKNALRKRPVKPQTAGLLQLAGFAAALACFIASPHLASRLGIAADGMPYALFRFGRAVVLAAFCLCITGGSSLFGKEQPPFRRLMKLRTKRCLALAAGSVLIMNLLSFRGATWPQFAQALLTAASAGIFEECLTRGVLLSGWLKLLQGKKHALLTAGVLSGCIFGLLHLMNLSHASVGAVLLQTFSAIMGGLFFAVLRIRYDSLGLPVLVHFLYDLKYIILLPPQLPKGYGWSLVPIAVLGGIAVHMLLQLEQDFRRASPLTPPPAPCYPTQGGGSYADLHERKLCAAEPRGGKAQRQGGPAADEKLRV